MRENRFALILGAVLAGAVAGLFGAGGGLVLVPILSSFGGLPEEEVFPTSLSIMILVCLICLVSIAMGSSLPWAEAFPYLLGSAAGGVLAGVWGRKIPALWLHRGLGVLILWGGWRYLWQ